MELQQVSKPYIAGDPESFKRLYESVSERIVMKMLKIFKSRPEAEDCMQEAFVKAFDHWDQWLPTSSAESWVMRIAINCAMDHLRRSKIRTADETIRRLGLPEGGKDPLDLVISNEMYNIVHTLPPKIAESMVYRYYYGYTNRAIAKILNRPERTVASRLASGRELLRKPLAEFVAKG